MMYLPIIESVLVRCMLVFVEDAAEAVASAGIKAGGGQFREGWRQRVQWPGGRDALMRPLGVVEVLELAQGVQHPLSTTVSPASLSTVSNMAGYLLSRSRIRNFVWLPASSRSMTGFLATFVTQAAVGCGVAPRIRIRRYP